MKEFREWAVWLKAYQFNLAVYRVDTAFPREELYGLTSQLRRPFLSIPANRAEGCGRDGDAELARFCFIAMGSASELEYHLPLARELNHVKPLEYADLTQRTVEVKRMLATLIKTRKEYR